MPTLNLKPTHKPVKAYYAALDQFARLGVTHETAVLDDFRLTHAYWKAKEIHDDLPAEVERKFAAGCLRISKGP